MLDEAWNQYRKGLISMSPSFTCPVTKKILDYRRLKIYTARDNQGKLLRTFLVDQDGAQEFEMNLNEVCEKLSCTWYEETKERFLQ